MILHCIFPSVSYEDKIPDILKTFHSTINPALKGLGATNVSFTFAGLDYTFVETGGEFHGKPKGQAIIDALRNLTFQPDFVIICDGSVKIPLQHIPNVFTLLISDSSVAAVMGARADSKLISSFRYL